MYLIALPGALFVGLSLGLFGSGGSILTVPILVYLLGQDEKVAIASSLAIVGMVSLIGSLPYIKQKLIHWRTVVTFGIPGVIGTYAGAAVSVYVSGAVQMVVFALVMAAAATLMLKPLAPKPSDAPRHIMKVGLDGFIVGGVTGFVGVGGGFLIVPALIILGGLTMQQAVATSLMIIAMKSLVGFAKYTAVIDTLNLTLDTEIIAFFVLAGAIGSFGGNHLASHLSQDKLKHGFGYFLIVVAAFIMVRTIVF